MKTTSDPIETALKKLRPSCILSSPDEGKIIIALAEMLAAGMSERKSADDERLITARERLAESVMMRLRKECHLGINCQVKIKEALVGIFEEGRG